MRMVDPSVAIEPSLVTPLNLICDSGNSSAESVADRLAALTRLRQETAARLSYGRCAHNGTVVGCFTNDGGWRLLLAEASHRQQMALLDEHRSRLESPPPASIDLVMSIVEGTHAPRDLQPADLAPARLRLHRDVRVTTVVYAKNKSFTGARPVEVAREPGFVRRATPYNEKLRNAHAYFRHVVDHYDELADTTLFLKTNRVNVEDAIGMARTAASGRFPFDSHPWLPLPRVGQLGWAGRRRFLRVQCDDRWRNRTWLYPLLCPCRRLWPLPTTKTTHEHLLISCEDGRPRGYLSIVAHGEPVPLVGEHYSEGMFAVTRKLIHQRPRALYEALVRTMESSSELHDEALQVWQYLFPSDLPAWQASLSLTNYPSSFEALRDSPKRQKPFGRWC